MAVKERSATDTQTPSTTMCRACKGWFVMAVTFCNPAPRAVANMKGKHRQRWCSQIFGKPSRSVCLPGIQALMTGSYISTVARLTPGSPPPTAQM